MFKNYYALPLSQRERLNKIIRDNFSHLYLWTAGRRGKHGGKLINRGNIISIFHFSNPQDRDFFIRVFTPPSNSIHGGTVVISHSGFAEHILEEELGFNFPAFIGKTKSGQSVTVAGNIPSYREFVNDLNSDGVYEITPSYIPPTTPVEEESEISTETSESSGTGSGGNEMIETEEERRRKENIKLFKPYVKIVKKQLREWKGRGLSNDEIREQLERWRRDADLSVEDFVKLVGKGTIGEYYPEVF